MGADYRNFNGTEKNYNYFYLKADMSTRVIHRNIFLSIVS